MNTGIILSHIPFALALFLLLPTGKLPAGARFAALAGAALFTMIPVDGLSLAEYVRSLTNKRPVDNQSALAGLVRRGEDRRHQGDIRAPAPAAGALL